MTQRTTLAEAAEYIRAAQQIALVTHLSPDPDAIGSALGLTLALERLGKTVAVLCDDPVPDEVRFLPAADRLAASLPEGMAPDLLVALDSSDLERLGEAAAPLLAAGIPILNIDHHITNLNYGTVNLVDPNCAATAELVVALLNELGAGLTRKIATCLLAALVGDTRAFSTPSVTPTTLRVAARLVEDGANLAAIVEAVFNRHSFDDLRMIGLALANAQRSDSVIWTVLSQAERQEHALLQARAKGLSNLLLSADGASMAAVFEEKEGGEVEISFRASPGYDVASLALSLGGGGHPQAAGCTVPGPLEEAVTRVLGMLVAESAAQSAPDREAGQGEKGA